MDKNGRARRGKQQQSQNRHDKEGRRTTLKQHFVGRTLLGNFLGEIDGAETSKWETTLIYGLVPMGGLPSPANRTRSRLHFHCPFLADRVNFNRICFWPIAIH